MMKNEFKKIAKAIRAARSILVATHRDPDGDAIGSLLAMGLYLQKIGKRPYIFSVSKPSARVFGFLPGFGRITSRPPKKKFDLVIGLDHSTRDRLGLEDYFPKYPTRLVSFDHHPAGPQLNDLGVIDESYVAAAHLVFDYFKAVGFRPDKNIARALLTGLLTDTGFFKFVKKPAALEAAAELVRFGVSISELYNKLYGHQSREAVVLSGKILERVEHEKKGNFNFTYVLKRELGNIDLYEIGGVLERISNIKDGKFSLFLIQEPAKIWRCRFRSRPDQHFNVAHLAKNFGGGGHPEAAGCRIKAASTGIKNQIDEVLKSVAKYARKM